MAEEIKHREVSRQLRAAIASGRFAATGRLPGEPQLAAEFGVSRPTVSRALLDLQHEGLVERRAGSGTYLRRGGPSAASPQGGRQLGLLIPGLGTTEIFELICGELASLARVNDFTLLWGGSAHPGQDNDSTIEHAEALCHQFIERKVNGVFFAPYELLPGKEQPNRRLAETLRQAGIPVVLLDRDILSFPNRSDFDVVGLDNMAGGYMLTEHLVKLGCRTFYFVARPHSAPTVDARVAGVREALVRHRLDPDASWLRFGDPADLKFARGVVAGKSADALVCANDNTAATLLRSLSAIGVKVPRDVRVVGFDDAKYATLVSPPLTTVHQPCRDIAVAAYRAMLDRIAEPTLPARSLLLTPRLAVRESCGAYLSRMHK